MAQLRPRLLIALAVVAPDRGRRDGAVRRRRARAARRAARGRGAALATGRAARPRPQARADAGQGGRRSGSASRCSSLTGSSPGLDLGAPTVVVCAYGLLIPDDAARGAALAQRPPVAPAALARRRARRARDPGRRHRDGRDDPPHRQGARRGPDRRSARVPDRPRRRRRRRLRAGRRGSRSSCSTRFSPAARRSCRRRPRA